MLVNNNQSINHYIEICNFKNRNVRGKHNGRVST